VAVAIGLPLLILASLFIARHGRGPDDRGRMPAARGARPGTDPSPPEDGA
jgi:hypothetical protein